MNRLVAEHVVKRYRKGACALRGLSLDIGPGVLGLLGKNGAGKSSLMRIIATVASATEGKVTWNGRDILEHPEPLRRVLGYLPQDFGVYPDLSATEFLMYVASLKEISASVARPQIVELLEQLNLSSAANRSLAAASGGMRQRVGIAQALLGAPELLIVDEPTVGLDPLERSRFLELIYGSARERIVILSTHIVADIEMVANTVAIIDEGRLLACGQPDDLIRDSGPVWEGRVATEELAMWRESFPHLRAVPKAAGYLVRFSADTAPQGFRSVEPSLEDVYFKLTEGSRIEA
jgi:ABC-2 type transport system ATP-binding protein